MSSYLPQTDGRKLRLFQASDPLKTWWSLDKMRICAKCERLFLGREIKISEDEFAHVAFHRPGFQCSGSWEDWNYPELHL